MVFISICFNINKVNIISSKDNKKWNLINICFSLCFVSNWRNIFRKKVVCSKVRMKELFRIFLFQRGGCDFRNNCLSNNCHNWSQSFLNVFESFVCYVDRFFSKLIMSFKHSEKCDMLEFYPLCQKKSGRARERYFISWALLTGSKIFFDFVS